MPDLKLQVELLTAEGHVLSAEADFVVAPGVEGDLGVLPRHIPLLTPLRTGEIMVRNNGAEDFFFVAGGFLEVTPEKVVILADVAERAEDIDEESAEAARKAAQDALAQDEGDADAAAQLERAIFRLRIADIRRGHHRDRRGDRQRND